MPEPITDAELEKLRRNKYLSFRLQRMIARIDDAEGEGCTLHGHAPHGQEAEELRKGIERLLAENPLRWRSDLQLLLDRVPARDSLAHLRANEELAEARAKVAELEKAGATLREANEGVCELCQDKCKHRGGDDG